MSYPKREVERTEGNAMFPEGLPTKKEQERMEDHAKAARINEARDNGFVADFFSLREQDTYVKASSVKSMMWEVADGAEDLIYELGTLYLLDDDGFVTGRIQIEERSPYPFHKKAKQGAPMCLALSRPEEPLESRNEITPKRYWTREERIVESEEVSVHQGPHGIQWARVWNQRDVSDALGETLDVDAPDLR